jgi:hypothetical protein
MLGGAIANGLNLVVSQTETFENPNGQASPARMAFVTFLTVLLVLAALLFFGKFLWNSVLHELVPAIKPVKSVWQILGIALLLSLLNPGSCSCAA